MTVRGMLRAEPRPLASRVSDSCDCFGDEEPRGDSSTTSVWDDEDAASPASSVVAEMEEAAMGDCRPSGERESMPSMVGGMSRGLLSERDNPQRALRARSGLAFNRV